MRKFLINAVVIVILTTAPSYIFGQQSPPESDGPTKVLVRIGLLDLSEVSDESQGFTANIFFEATWNDPGLAHDGEAAISKPVNAVWTPEFAIVNRRGSITATLPDVVTISPEGNVTLRQRAYGNFAQPLDLRDFPFDRQEFRILLVSANSFSGDIQILQNPDLPSRVASKLSIPDWTLEKWSVSFDEFRIEPGAPGRAAAALRFEAKRKQGYFVYKIILPLVLIVSMSWVVFWIIPGQYAPRLGLPATVMLTVIAYRYSIDQLLPQLSYLTRIDLFILSSTVLVYVTLLESAIVSSLYGKGREQVAKRIDWVCRFVFPGLFFVCAYITLIY